MSLSFRISAILIISLLFLTQAYARDLKAYQLFTKDGEAVDFGQMVIDAAQNQVILFGEIHNNPISHWLQLELSKALLEKKGRNLVMGAEMFETHDQLIIDEYLGGLIQERNFNAEARLWRNFETDIKPLLELARENQLRFVATNIPRRYAALVNRQGFEGLEDLSKEALKYIAPLPVSFDPELPGYKAMLEMTGMPAHSSENFPKAQAIKDATMAHFLQKNLDESQTFIHFHGTYHSNNYEGIMWYLLQSNPGLTILTIATVEQDDIITLEEDNLHIADYIIAVPSSMTKTY